MNKSKVNSSFRHMGRYKRQIDLFLHNPVVLYIFVFTAVVFILFYAASRNINAVLLFFLVGFLTFFFSKNMIVVIFMAILVSGVFYILDLPYLGKNKYFYIEGMEDEEPTDISGGIGKKSPKDLAKKTTSKNSSTSESLNQNSSDKNTFEEMFDSDSNNQDYEKQIEKLKLQNQLLDKVKNLEAFIPFITSSQGSKK